VVDQTKTQDVVDRINALHGEVERLRREVLDNLNKNRELNRLINEHIMQAEELTVELWEALGLPKESFLL
jgi:hypothetical protein